jgi:hypothetical protein
MRWPYKVDIEMTETFEVGRKAVGAASPGSLNWPCIFLCCLPLIALRAWILFTPSLPYDFLTYWSAGHQFLIGGHPYSEAAILATEGLSGMPAAKPQLMLAPPWTLPIVAAMALLPFRAAQIGWFVFTLLLNCFSSIGLWKYFGGKMRRAWIAILISLTFIPMGGAEYMNQITPLMLACLTAFLLLLMSRKNFAAGVMLLGVGFKPHLLYLFLLAVLLWIIQKRAWTLLAGVMAGYGTATLATVLRNPYSMDYFHHTYSVAIEVHCGVGWVLRTIFGVQHSWLQFLPCVFGFAWFLYYWIKHRRQWDWQIHLPLLLVVSISTSPYCWYHDFIFILPALITLAVQGTFRFPSVPAAYLGVQMIVVVAIALSMAWMCAASLLWIPFYVFASSVAKRKPTGVIDIEANADVCLSTTT